jgi:hypothetical protein
MDVKLSTLVTVQGLNLILIHERREFDRTKTNRNHSTR